MTTLSRPLPLELHEEIHKCLPLPNAIHILVNISSRAFVGINSDRMRRTIQRIKTSLHEYIGTLVNNYDYAVGREELWMFDDIEWRPKLDALIRYGAWLTPSRQFITEGFEHTHIYWIPKSFVEELLLHMANSRMPQMMLNYVRMHFETGALPIPTFMNQSFNEKQCYSIGNRLLLESVDFKAEDGRILHIFDGEFYHYGDNSSELRLFVNNKMDQKNWFQILIDVDPSEEFVSRLRFSKWNIQSFDIANFIREEGGGSNEHQIEQNGNKLEAKSNIFWYYDLDLLLRRGAAFTQIRHFKMNQYTFHWLPEYYIDFLIKIISNTKHPEDFLESIDMNLPQRNVDSLLKCILNFGLVEGIPKDGKLIELGKRKLHILSAKIANPKNKWLRSSSGELEFTLANGPTNGAYLFDFVVKLVNGLKHCVGIKIQKRKTDAIVELKCKDQIEMGKKRKSTNEDKEENEDGPTCSGKIMKQ